MNTTIEILEKRLEEAEKECAAISDALYAYQAVIDAYGIKRPAAKRSAATAAPINAEHFEDSGESGPPELSPRRQKIWDAMAAGDVADPKQLARVTKVPANQIRTELSNLYRSGHIERIGRGQYVKK